MAGVHTYRCVRLMPPSSLQRGSGASGLGATAGAHATARVIGMAGVHTRRCVRGRPGRRTGTERSRRSVIYNTRKHPTVLYCTAACHLRCDTLTPVWCLLRQDTKGSLLQVLARMLPRREHGSAWQVRSPSPPRVRVYLHRAVLKYRGVAQLSNVE